MSYIANIKVKSGSVESVGDARSMHVEKCGSLRIQAGAGRVVFYAAGEWISASLDPVD